MRYLILALLLTTSVSAQDKPEADEIYSDYIINDSEISEPIRWKVVHKPVFGVLIPAICINAKCYPMPKDLFDGWFAWAVSFDES